MRLHIHMLASGCSYHSLQQQQQERQRHPRMYYYLSEKPIFIIQALDVMFRCNKILIKILMLFA